MWMSVQVSAERVPTEPSMTRCTRSANPGAAGESSALWDHEEFSVQISHKSCPPGRCQDPNQKIVAMGDAFSDIKCERVTDGRMWFRLLSLYECFHWTAAIISAVSVTSYSPSVAFGLVPAAQLRFSEPHHHHFQCEFKTTAEERARKDGPGNPSDRNTYR